LHGLYLRVADDAHTALVIRLDQPSRVAWRPLPTHHVEPW
jgi:hypothetical protein